MLQLNCPEFDGFAEALQGVQGHYLLRERPRADWRLRVLDLDGVILMAGVDGSSNIFSGASMPGTFTAFCPVDDHSAIRVNGKRFDRQTIAWLAPNQMFHIDTDRPAKWMSVTIPIGQMEAWLTVHEYESKRESRLRTRSFCAIAGHALVSLTRMASQMFAIGTSSPDRLQDRATESAARKGLIDATLRTFLPFREPLGAGRSVISRSKILSRALSRIEAAGDESILSEDLSRAAGVSERTLRNAFQETFGMAPQEYLMLSKLNMARMAIRSADADMTLSRICTDLGFWDFGRFSSRYRQAFGVLPSMALSERRRTIQPN